MLRQDRLSSAMTTIVVQDRGQAIGRLLQWERNARTPALLDLSRDKVEGSQETPAA